jgi:hypothetical protein
VIVNSIGSLPIWQLAVIGVLAVALFAVALYLFGHGYD